jgi:hypothetical protein
MPIKNDDSLRIRLSRICVILFFALANGVIGQEWKFVEHNCAITVPVTWEILTNASTPPNVLGVFGKPDQSRLVMVIIDDQNNGPIDDRFVSDFERSANTRGVGKRISAQFVALNGIRGYERLGAVTLRGKDVSVLSQSFAADDKFYHLQGMRFDGDADKDSEIRKCLSSFRFIVPPRPPTVTPSPTLTAYRIGYLSGRIAPILVLIVIVGIVIIRAIDRRIARAKRHGRPTPPPLPPASR